MIGWKELIRSYHEWMLSVLKRAVKLEKIGLVFGYMVKDPEWYGVVEFDSSGKAIGSRRNFDGQSQITRFQVCHL